MTRNYQAISALRGIQKDRTLIIRLDPISLTRLQKIAYPKGTDAGTLAKRWILERLTTA